MADKQVALSEIPTLVDCVSGHFGQQISSLTPLLHTSYKHIYKAECEQGKGLVLRLYGPQTEKSSLQNHATNLLFLERNAIPAERLLRTSSGGNTLALDEWELLVTTFIEGQPLGSSLRTFHLLGKILGQLHSIAPLSAKQPLPASQLLPTQEIAYGLAELSAVAKQVPGSLRSRYDLLIAALRSMPNYEELPQVFIHGDCHPGNGIHSISGDIVLVDWEDAGLGPSIVDLAYLVLSCDQLAPWLLQSDFRGSNPWPEERLRAVIEGYTSQRTLTSEELNIFPDALRFRSLVFGAVNLAKMIRGEATEDETLWWWKRYTASDELARRIRALLERPARTGREDSPSASEDRVD